MALTWKAISCTDRRHGVACAVLIAMLSLIMMFVTHGVEVLVQQVNQRQPAYVGDPSWVPYQVGTEHARLLLALETGVDAAVITRRGEVYLSFADRLRSAPLLSIDDKVLDAQFAHLDETFRVTERLLADVNTPGGREALRQQLRRDDSFITDFTLSLSKLYRKKTETERALREEMLHGYLSLLHILHVALLGLVLIASWMALRLLHLGRERDRQHATQTRILDAVGDGIIGISREGRVLYTNVRASDVLGCQLEEGRQLPAARRGEPELLRGMRRLLNTLITGPAQPSSVTHDVTTGMGEARREFILSLCPDTRDWDGEEVDGSQVITIRDVTAEREAARQSEAYKSGLSRVSRVMSYAVITGGIVHEISQPLASLRNYIHMLRLAADGDDATKSQRILVARIAGEAGRVSEIIQNVRQIDKREARFDGNCCLAEAVTQSVRLVSLGVSPPPPIKVSIADDGNWRVVGSLPLMGQVILNLLRNALQASASGGQSGAEIVLRKCDGFAEVGVIDFGRGVGPEAAARLFEPFSASSSGGMGLGLAICNRIASSLGGAIAWHNRQSGGAVFTFTVPVCAEG